MNGYQPDFWHWWILALALIIAETVLPGTFFLWMGVSAVVMGVLAWLIPAMGWETQVMLFAVLSLVSIVGWRMYQRRHPDETDQPTLNRRGEQYVDRVFTLETAIENGYGKVRVGDSLWRVKGEDAVAGTKVRVTEADGIVLVVERAD
jgi:membrane protein implicated in regulation of membrane protease activity